MKFLSIRYEREEQKSVLVCKTKTHESWHYISVLFFQPFRLRDQHLFQPARV